MNILTTITGLMIAAVLNVPGTNQREVAPVEEEPVVKENITQNAYWRFKEDTMQDAFNPSNYEPSDGSDTGCGSPGDVVCILEIEGGEPESLQDLETFLQNLNNNESALLAAAIHKKEEPDPAR